MTTPLTQADALLHTVPYMLPEQLEGAEADHHPPHHRVHEVELSSGTTVGAHEIVAQLRPGGMGEVYRARDSRSVATSREAPA